MKNNLYFKSLTAIVLVVSTVFLASCVKDRDNETDFSKLFPIMQIKEGGLDNFAKQALLFPATDPVGEAFLHVNYAAKAVTQNDIVVTLAIDVPAMVKYNADALAAAIAAGLPAPIPYELFPDSIFSFTQTSVTVKAGQDLSDAVKLTVYPDKINSAKSYMLPITITNASGVVISGNFGTIYYHVIGNPLAGDYQDYGQRFNYGGAVPWTGPAAGLGLATAPGVPSVNPPPGNTGITVYNFVVTFAPVNEQTVQGEMGNVPDPAGGGAFYFVTGNATFSAINYDFSATFNAGYSNISRYIRGYVAPSPTQKPAFRLVTQYNNATGGAGSDRIIDETFIHQ